MVGDRKIQEENSIFVVESGRKPTPLKILFNQRKVSGLFYHFVLPPPDLT